MEDTGHSFGAYFKRATSPIVVLAILRERPMYVYELAAAMKERSAGKFTISVLYPVLYRLESQGYVEIQNTEIVEGRARRHLAQCLREYDEMTKVFDELVKKGTAQ